MAITVTKFGFKWKWSFVIASLCLTFFGPAFHSKTWRWRSAEAWERLRTRPSQSWSPTLEIETRNLFCFVFPFFVCLFLFKSNRRGIFSSVTFPFHFFFLKMSSKSPLQVLCDWCNNNWFSTLLTTQPPVNYPRQTILHPRPTTLYPRPTTISYSYSLRLFSVVCLRLYILTEKVRSEKWKSSPLF